MRNSRNCFRHGNQNTPMCPYHLIRPPLSVLYLAPWGLFRTHRLIRSRQGYRRLLGDLERPQWVESQLLRKTCSSMAVHFIPSDWVQTNDDSRQEGFHAFYKGITPRIMRVAPGQAVTFTVYEFLKDKLERYQDGMPLIGGKYEE